MGIHGIQAGEDHGLDVLKAGQRLDGGPGIIGNGVANLGVGHILDVGDDEADFAGIERIHRHRLGREHAQGFNFEGAAIGPQANSLPAGERALENSCQHDDAAVGIKPGIKNQRLQMGVGRALGRRQPLDNGL